MKSVFLNIVNIILVTFVLVIIYLLVLDAGRISETDFSESADIFNNYTSQKISIKQLDSLSASANFHFSKYFASNLLPRE
ncbi:MAG TPA: hypothetical protein VLH59_11430 [Ignavibacteriaceae bacterium]|nr:hypothetical protein [Ignavibacteriaceae bacterium]